MESNKTQDQPPLAGSELSQHQQLFYKFKQVIETASDYVQRSLDGLVVTPENATIQTPCYSVCKQGHDDQNDE
jgi:hypothetical protein